MSHLFSLLQVVILLLIAPMLQGLIKTTKARLQGRKGPSLSQPLYDLKKYWNKEQVVSHHVSWIYTMTPLLVTAIMVMITALVPVVSTHTLLFGTGDWILVIYLFALSRFMMSLAALDTGSAFGAMGSSRHMFLSIFAEPVLLVAGLAMVIRAGSMNLSVIASRTGNVPGLFALSTYMVLLAFYILLMAETGRLPVDNPDTHLELTMIHEGMLLEYSGRPLALMMYSTWLKQALLSVLLIDFCVPWGIATGASWGHWLIGLLLLLLKLFVIGLLMAVTESAYAKLRLFRVPRLFVAAFVLAVASIVTQTLQ